MNSTCHKILLVLFAVSMICMPLLAMDAGEVNEAAGRSKGLIAMPGVTASKTPIALADGGYLVYAVCPDQKSYDAVVSAALDKNYLAQRVYVELDPSIMPAASSSPSTTDPFVFMELSDMGLQNK